MDVTPRYAPDDLFALSLHVYYWILKLIIRTAGFVGVYPNQLALFVVVFVFDYDEEFKKTRPILNGWTEYTDCLSENTAQLLLLEECRFWEIKKEDERKWETKIPHQKMALS